MRLSAVTVITLALLACQLLTSRVTVAAPASANSIMKKISPGTPGIGYQYSDPSCITECTNQFLACLAGCGKDQSCINNCNDAVIACDQSCGIGR